MNEFYVYQYLDSNGKIYYVGKGKGNRAYKKHGQVRVPIDHHNIVIVEKNLSEKDALILEYGLINLHKRKIDGGTLENITTNMGGFSGGTKKTDEFLNDIRSDREKGHSIRYLCEKYKIGVSTVLDAVGDIKVKEEDIIFVRTTGRPSAVTENTKQEVKTLIEQGVSARQIAKKLRIGMGTLYKLANELTSESQEFSEIYSKMMESRKPSRKKI